MSIAIRELGLADRAMVEELLDRFTPGWSDAMAPTASGVTAFVADPHAFMLGAYVDHDVAGWLWGTHFRRPNGEVTTYVDELEVAEPHRRRGIATLLMQAAFESSRAAGATALFLVTRERNEIAQQLYRELDGDEETFRRYVWDLGPR